MDKIFDVLGNPFLWGVIIFVLGFLLKKKLNTYLKLLNLLIEAIEIIDTEIKDIVDDKTRESLLRIKEWIDRRVGKKERKVLDNALKNKGIFQKGEYKP
jgi:hypothetical protein